LIFFIHLFILLIYFILFFNDISLAGIGTAFWVIFPSGRSFCVGDLEPEKFQTILRLNNRILAAYNDENTLKMGKIDVADIDVSASTWDHVYTPKERNINNVENINNMENMIVNEKEVGKEAEEKRVKVVLYGVLGSTSFCEMHSILSVQADEGIVRYSTRPAQTGLKSLSEVKVFILFYLPFYCVYY
jgi:Thioredoxin-like domain